MTVLFKFYRVAYEKHIRAMIWHKWHCVENIKDYAACVKKRNKCPCLLNTQSEILGMFLMHICMYEHMLLKGWKNKAN
jgi:hypothetical protein